VESPLTPAVPPLPRFPPPQVRRHPPDLPSLLLLACDCRVLAAWPLPLVAVEWPDLGLGMGSEHVGGAARSGPRPYGPLPRAVHHMDLPFRFFAVGGVPAFRARLPPLCSVVGIVCSELSFSRVRMLTLMLCDASFGNRMSK
jgi:hypothetical protein